MRLLEAAGDELAHQLRPKSNFELAFTVRFPSTRANQFEFFEGEEVVAIENQIKAEKVADESLNVIKKARKWRDQREKAEGKSDKQLASELKVSPATLSIHLKLLKDLNPRIQTWVGNCQDEKLLRLFSFRKLMEFAKIGEAGQMDAFRQLLDSHAGDDAN